MNISGLEFIRDLSHINLSSMWGSSSEAETEVREESPLSKFIRVCVPGFQFKIIRDAEVLLETGHE